MNGFIYLFCKIRPRKMSGLRSLNSLNSGLCLFTLKGHFVNYLIETATDYIKDFVVTKDHQIFLLLKAPNQSFGLRQHTPPARQYKTISIKGCDFRDGGLSLLKSGHLAIALQSGDEYGMHLGTTIQIFC